MVFFNCISCMPEYANKSVEELRFEDYSVGLVDKTTWFRTEGFPAVQHERTGCKRASAQRATALIMHPMPPHSQDGCKGNTGAASPAAGGAFGATTAFGASSSPFGAPSSSPAFGAASSPAFGASAPAFGATSGEHVVSRQQRPMRPPLRVPV